MGMAINAAKSTQFLHVRNHQRPRSTFQCICGKANLDDTDYYEYLGYITHEYLNNVKTVNILTL